MKKFIAMAVALSLSACSNSQMDPGQMVGTTVGALIGGFAGGQFGGGAGQIVFMAIGGAVGAGAGYTIGSQLMPSDVKRFHNSAQIAMENTSDGQLLNWANPTTGVAGTIKPTRSYYAGQNTYCRDFEATIAVNSDIGEASARACKFAGGSWHLDPKV